MGDGKKKARKQAAEGGEPDQNGAETAPAKGGSKAERRARAGRKGKDAAAAEDGGASAGQPADLEERLARIEEAVANQAERSEALIAKLDEILNEARTSAGQAQSADD